MSTPHERTGTPGPRASIRVPQSLAGGIALLLFAALALWLNRDLPQGSLRSMGPSMLPDWLAYGVGLCGVVLVVLTFAGEGGTLDRWSLRGSFLVMTGIVGFAITIRPFSFGLMEIPGLGLVVAGPLAIIIGGFATPEARLRELIILSFSLTPFCMVLFGDLLNLPIPIFPLSLTGLFPADWSYKAILRASAFIMLMAALAVFLTGRGRNSSRIDVADNSGGI